MGIQIYKTSVPFISSLHCNADFLAGQAPVIVIYVENPAFGTGLAAQCNGNVLRILRLLVAAEPYPRDEMAGVIAVESRFSIE